MVAPTGGADGPQLTQTGLRLQILGPLRVWRDGARFETAGPDWGDHVVAEKSSTASSPRSSPPKTMQDNVGVGSDLVRRIVDKHCGTDVS